MKMRLFAVAVGLCIALGAGPALAKKKKTHGACQSVAQITSKVYKKYWKYAKKALKGAGPTGAKFVLVVEAADKAIKTFNKIVGDRSFAKIGPRRLVIGETDKGKVLKHTERTFLTATPLEEDKVTVTVKKTGGDGRAWITVCTADDDGVHRIDSKEIADGAFTVPVASNGKVVSVHIGGVKGGAFQYEVTASK